MNTWHIDDELLRRYQAGGADLPLAGSVETHLVACATCRQRAANAVASERREKIWQNIETAIDTPQPSILQRIQKRLRFPALAPPSTSAAASLTQPWWLATSALMR
jgi:anti-sigma factor ChrR (cupin superfamily)